MAIVFSCPRCDQRYSVPESMAGRRVTCKKCGQERNVPAAEAAPAPAPPPPAARPAAPRPPSARPPARPVAAFREEPPVLDEDDDLDQPLDDFDELPASAALMPRPKKPAYSAPAAPKVKKPKAVRREADDLPFPPIVTFGLCLFGLLFLLAGGSMVANESQKGNPNASLLGVVMILFVASFGLMIVAVFKVLLHANTYSGFLAALGCFFIPFFIVGYVILNFHDTKRYLLWYGGGVVGMIVTALMLPAFAQVGRADARRGGAEADAREAAAAALPPGFVIPGGHAQDYPLEVIATGLPDEVSAELFRKKLDDVLEPNPGGRGMFGGGWANGGSTTTVFPVRDPRAFMNRITFAKDMKLSGRTLTLTADLSEADLADARQVKADEKAREAEVKAVLDAQAVAAAKPKAESENPFQEKPSDNPFQEKPKPAPDPYVGSVDNALAGLRQADAAEVRKAIRALESGVPEDRKDDVLAALGPLLDSDDLFTVNAALKAVATLGPEAEPALIKKLSDPNALVRVRACEILTEIGGAKTIKAMRNLPPDASEEVRSAAKNAVQVILKRTTQPSRK